MRQTFFILCSAFLNIYCHSAALLVGVYERLTFSCVWQPPFLRWPHRFSDRFTNEPWLDRSHVLLVRSRKWKPISYFFFDSSTKNRQKSFFRWFGCRLGLAPMLKLKSIFSFQADNWEICTGTDWYLLPLTKFLVPSEEKHSQITMQPPAITVWMM